VVRSSLLLRVKRSPQIEEIAVPAKVVPVLLSGEEYGFRLGAMPEATYLYIFQVDASGTITALFPNRSYTDAANPVDAPEGTLLPGGAPGWYQLDDTVGNETVYAVFSHERQAEAERLLALAARSATAAEVRSGVEALLLTQTAAEGSAPRPVILTLRIAHRRAAHQ
jgi:hypothetical protein